MAPDFVRAEGALTRMVALCAGYETALREALALLEASGDAAEPLARADGAAEQVALLGRELEVWWPVVPGGVRLAEGVPEGLLTAAREFAEASARCAELVEAVAERLRAGGSEVSALLNHVRVQRRTSRLYHPRSSQRGRLDLEG